MLIVMEDGASEEDVARVVAQIEAMGYRAHPIAGTTRTTVAVTAVQGPLNPADFEGLARVKEAIPVSQPWTLVSREARVGPTQVTVAGRALGAGRLAIIAGPCAVESHEQTAAIARAVKAAGAHFLRGGAYKPRTSPYSFQGLGEEGLKILARVREETGLPVVTEAMDTETLDMVADYADVIQIGTRSMQNFPLLRKAGRCRRPILLKRGMSATIEELLMSAEYIAAGGNQQIILCERGIRTFAAHTRCTLDLSAIPAVKARSHLPIIVDPSHGTGRRDMVRFLSRAAIAAGADGLLVEVHNDPDHALSDGAQSLLPDQFAGMMDEIRAIARVVGMTL